MENQVKVIPFESDKQFLKNTLNSFGTVIVFIFYSDVNEKSKQFLANFQSSVPIFGAYKYVTYYSVEASRCPETLAKFNVQITPTVIFTQTDKKVHKRYESPQDIGQMFDQLSTQIQKYRQQYQADKKIWQPKIQSILSSCPVIIFIKGTPQNPKCGFTRTLIQILKENNVQFTYIDIVQDEYMRYWVRALKNWPTYPQIFINGKFVGGLDIVKQLIQKGEFTKIVPESSRTQDAELKYNILVKQNENIVFTNNFAFENKQTESFLNKQREKYGNVYVYNANLDNKLHEFIKNNLKVEFPFLVIKGEIQKA